MPEIPEFVSRIVDAQEACYFVSPHLDDAVLSAGGLLSYLAPRTPVHVTTVFTQGAPGPYSLSERSFLRQTGYRDLVSLYADRVNENRAVLDMVPAPYSDLGFVDSLCRQKPGASALIRRFGNLVPELNRVYPIYRIQGISGRVSPLDRELMDLIAAALCRLTAAHERVTVFCPLGIGGHVDHVLVREVCAGTFNKVVFWSDFPYNLKNPPLHDYIQSNGLSSFEFADGLPAKGRLIDGYASQIKPLFGDAPVPLLPETYYYRR